MKEMIFTSLPIEDLTAEISSAVIKQITPIINRAPQAQPREELMTRKEAAKLLGITLPTLFKWTQSGKIIGYRIGSRVRYKRSELNGALSQIRTQ